MANALKGDFGAGPVPQLFGKGVWSGSHHLGITTREMSADEKQGAQYFIAWISEHSLEWAKAGQIPARQSVRNSAEQRNRAPHGRIKGPPRSQSG